MNAWREAAEPLDWSSVDTVLLDMDGTLLDLGFDNWFWLERVPKAYAEARALSYGEAQDLLTARFAAARGTLSWYCLDHWSGALELDLRTLKRECAARIRFLPGARQFLERLGALGKRRVLVTNAHPDTLAIKAARVGLLAYVDESHSTHPYGRPKEDPEFWPALRDRLGFLPERTLLVDDSPPVLAAAAQFGIRWLRAIRRPEADVAPRETGPFAAVDAIGELLL